MARTAYSQNSYVGGAVSASLTGAINSTTGTISLTFSGTSYTTWTGLGIVTSPSGATASAGFFLSLDYNTASQEKVWVPAQSISWTASPITLTNVVRGQDGTTAVSHSASAGIIPVLTASDISEGNYAVSQTVGQVQSAGDLLVGSSSGTLARLPVGTSGQVLGVSSTGAVGYQTLNIIGTAVAMALVLGG